MLAGALDGEERDGNGSLLFQPSGALERCHPDPRFVQPKWYVSTCNYPKQPETKCAPKQFSYQFSEVDPLLSNEVKSEFASIPATKVSKHGRS